MIPEVRRALTAQRQRRAVGPRRLAASQLMDQVWCPAGSPAEVCAVRSPQRGFACALNLAEPSALDPDGSDARDPPEAELPARPERVGRNLDRGRGEHVLVGLGHRHDHGICRRGPLHADHRLGGLGFFADTG